MSKTQQRTAEELTALIAFCEDMKKVEDANTVWFSNYIRVLNDRNRQSKALCVKLVQYGTPAVKNAKKNGSGSTNEAASILEDRFAAIFGD